MFKTVQIKAEEECMSLCSTHDRKGFDAANRSLFFGDADANVLCSWNGLGNSQKGETLLCTGSKAKTQLQLCSGYCISNVSQRFPRNVKPSVTSLQPFLVILSICCIGLFFLFSFFCLPQNLLLEHI